MSCTDAHACRQLYRLQSSSAGLYLEEAVWLHRDANQVVPTIQSRAKDYLH